MNNESLPPRNQIKHVARELLKKGIKPSQNNVKDGLSSSSSNTTIRKALDEFWVEVSAELEANDSRPGIPDELFNIAKELWDASLKSAYKAAEERMEKAIKVEAKALEEVAELRSQIQTLTKKHEETLTEFDKTKALLAKEKASSSELGALLVKSQENVRDLQAQLQNTIDRNDDFRESSDSRLDSLMTEHNRLREAFDERERDLKSRLDLASDENKQLNESLIACRHAVTNLEKYKDLYTHEQQVNERFATQQDKLTKANSELTEKMQAMMDKMDRQRDKYDTHIEEMRNMHSLETTSLKENTSALQAKILELQSQIPQISDKGKEDS